MKKFIFILGTNGSGKSTLVRNLLLSDYKNEESGDFLFDCFDFYEKNTKYGSYTISKGGKYSAIGKYSIKCGGADLINNKNDYYYLIDFLCDNYNFVCVEGVMARAFDDLVKCFDRVNSKGFEIIIIKLSVDLETAINRVIGRNGRMPNSKNVEGKLNAFNNFFEKLKELNKFKCLEIQTENRTTKEVFDIFIKNT